MKKYFIGFGVLCALLVGALLVAPSFIDWTKYRTEITAKVKDVTGRDLVIGGDIVFKLLPSPILSVSDLRLSNAEGASHADMAAIRQLDVQIHAMPLLSGNLHIQSIRLIEPIIHLEQIEGQAANWELQPPGQASEATTIETPSTSPGPQFEDTQSSPAEPLPLQIDDFIIERGEVHYTDLGAGVNETIAGINTRFSLASLSGPFEAIGTLRYGDIPLGFETTVGQIVHGRTATFATEIKFAHGATSTRISGTAVNLSDGPKVTAKIESQGESLSGLINAFAPAETWPGGLNRAFGLSGDIVASPNRISFGEEGVSVNLGQDRASLFVEAELGEANSITARIESAKIDADAWTTAETHTPTKPAPLPLVIEPTQNLLQASGGRVSATLGASPQTTAPTDQVIEEAPPASLPENLNVAFALDVDSVILKGEPIRQLQAQATLAQGEIALERLSAILPGAGEVNVFGIAGPRAGKLAFDGSLDASVAHLRGALSWLDVNVPNIALDRLQQLSLSSQISADADELRLNEISVQMDGSTLQGGVVLALTQRPSFGASFSLDRVNLDAYQAKPSTSSASKTPAPQQEANPSPQGPGSDAGFNPASLIKSLEVLDSFDANIALSAGQITLNGEDIKNLNADATIYNGTVTIRDLSVQDFAGAKLAVDGKILRQESSILTENLTARLSSKNLTKAANSLMGPSDIDWRAFGSVDITTSLNGNLLMPELDLNANLLGGTILVSGAADLLPLPKVDATANLQFDDLRTITRALGTGYQPSTATGPIALSADIAATATGAKISNIDAEVARAPLSGTIDLKTFAPLNVTAALNAGTLNLTPFAPKEQQSASTNRPSSSNARSTSPTSPVKRDGKTWSREPIDLSGLQGVNADISLQAEGIIYDKIRLSNNTTRIIVKNGVMDIDQSIGNIFGGPASLKAQVDASQGPARIRASSQANGLSLASILALSEAGVNAKGTLGLKADLSAVGASEYDLISNLNGSAETALKRVSAAKKGNKPSPLDLLNFLAVLSGTDPSKGLADVNVRSNIANGVAQLTQAQLTSNIANGTMGGQVDLPNWVMDIEGNLQVQQNALIGLIAQQTKMKSDYPFSFKGAINSPNIKLDTGGISSGGGLVIPIPDQLDKSGVGNVLRGLLGAGGVQTSPAQKNESSPKNAPPAQDGSLAPPPPPPGGSNRPAQPPSVEEQLLRGLGTILSR